MAGTLFVVATPIGHLRDITLRALEVLRDVSVVAAEDTRHTGNLLRHFQISTRLISLHEHNERARTGELLTRLNRGESVAVVTDAGTPGISDPGAELVRRARAEGIPINAVPGPSAVTAAISISGLADSAFSFLGFPPIRSKDRKQWFDRFERCRLEGTIICFEAPHRVHRTLRDLSYLVEQPIMVCRELTKVHEETYVGSPTSIIESITNPRGEFVIVVPRSQTAKKTAPILDQSSWADEIGQLTENGVASKRQAARIVAKRLGLSTRDVYEATKD